MNAELPPSKGQRFTSSSVSDSVVKYRIGAKIPIDKIQDRKMSTARSLLVIMTTFMGNTIATNLSTVINTRFATETEYETRRRNIPSLH